MSQAGKQRLIKFYKYYKEWYTTYKTGAIKGVTFDKYELTYKWVKKLAPDLVLGKMTRADFQKIINEYGKTHEIQTVRDFYHHVAPSIDDAVYEGWIPGRNPNHKIRMVSTKRVRQKPLKYLEIEDVKKLEKVLAMDQTGFGDFFDFLLRTGLRFAEALGITPDDIDENEMTIYINKTFNYKINTQNRADHPEYGDFIPTKNKYSVRMLTIDSKALNDLKKHMGDVDDDEAIWPHWYQNDCPIVRESARYGHPCIFNSIFNHQLEIMCYRAGTSHTITVHGLRHTHASILIANGVSIQSVAKRLGHGDTQTTQQTYIHLLDQLEQRDNQRIASIMNGI